jgi:hypothetical protein
LHGLIQINQEAGKIGQRGRAIDADRRAVVLDVTRMASRASQTACDNDDAGRRAWRRYLA